MVVSFLGFLFALYIWDSWSWRSWQPWNANWCRKKKPQKKAHSLTKEQGKGQPSKTKKILDNSCSTQAKHHRKEWPHPYQQRPCKASPGCKGAPTLPLLHRGGFRKGRLRSWDFYPHWVIMRQHSHPWCQCRPFGELGLLPSSNEAPASLNLSTGWSQRDLLESQYFHHCPVLMRPHKPL